MTSSRPAGRGGRWARLLLAAGVVVLYSHRLGAAGLFELDEARYAAVAREMVESGDWLVPRLNGITHLTKPPLAYWSAAAAFRLLGPTETAARLGPLAAALATLAAVWGIGRRLAGPAAAGWAVAVLATSPGFFVMGRTLTPDIFLTAGCTLAILGAVLGWRGAGAGAADRAGPAGSPRAGAGCGSGAEADGSEADRLRGGRGAGGRTSDPEAGGRTSRRAVGSRAGRLGAGLFWGGLAVGFLAKGPVALVVVGSALGGCAAAGGCRRLCGLLRWWGPVLFAGVGLSWYALVAWRIPGLAGYWLGQEVLGRIASDVHHRSGPWYYFVPVLVVGSIPWSLLLPIAAAAPAPAGGESAAGRRLLLAWLLVPLSLLSLSRSKLPTYLLPLLPAAALLVGGYLARLPALVGTCAAGWTAAASAVVAVGVAAGLAVIGWQAPQALAGALAADAPLLEEAAEVLGPLAAGAGLAAAALLAGRAGLARVAWIAAAGVMLVQVVHELPDVAAVQSLKGLAAIVEGSPGGRVATYHVNRYGLRFYTDRPVLEVGGRDLRFEPDPLDAARRVAPADDAALVAAAREAAAGGSRLFVLARAADAGRLQALLPVPLEPAGRAGQLVLLATALPASPVPDGP